MSLFWRTFVFLMILQGGGILAWFHTYQILELGPQNNAIAAHMVQPAHVQHLDFWHTLNDLRQTEPRDKTWLFWMGIAGIFSIAGAAAIAQLLNHPLTEIVRATASVQEGNFKEAHLNEDVFIQEVGLVNHRFNAMTTQLAQMEADRTLMLAGISHDLRTPLARIRLELELNVDDHLVKESITHDIEQIDHIIDQFLDYARAVPKALVAVPIAPIVEQVCQAFKDHPQLLLQSKIPFDPGLMTRVNPTELKRILSNLFENAARYGRHPDQVKAQVDVGLQWKDPWIVITVRDHGPGVPAAELKRLTEPFYRSDETRSQANGAGLGLAIVAKTLHRMKGTLHLSNHPQGGLVARLQVHSA